MPRSDFESPLMELNRSWTSGTKLITKVEPEPPPIVIEGGDYAVIQVEKDVWLVPCLFDPYDGVEMLAHLGGEGTALGWEVDYNGFGDLFPPDSDTDWPMAWALENGIAPYQEFIVRITVEWNQSGGWYPDYYECDPDWAVELVWKAPLSDANHERLWTELLREYALHDSKREDHEAAWAARVAEAQSYLTVRHDYRGYNLELRTTAISPCDCDHHWFRNPMKTITLLDRGVHALAALIKDQGWADLPFVLSREDAATILANIASELGSSDPRHHNLLSAVANGTAVDWWTLPPIEELYDRVRIFDAKHRLQWQSE